MEKNLLTRNSVYNAYYGDFRGVDFSSDHTQVHKQRLAYAVNMFKDYQSGQGQAIETIPGFRRRFVAPCGAPVYGIHHIRQRVEGADTERVLVHAGQKLYLWRDYPSDVGIEKTFTMELGEGTVHETLSAMHTELNGVETTVYVFTITLEETYKEITSIIKPDGEEVLANELNGETLTITASDLIAGDVVTITAKTATVSESDVLFGKTDEQSKMNERESVSFVFRDKLYLLDGENYLVFDGDKVTKVSANAYVPTTYEGVVVGGDNANAGEEHEQRNILSPYFKHSFVADGTTTDFYLNERGLSEISEVTVNGEVVKAQVNGENGEVVTNYSVDTGNGKVTFTTAPPAPTVEGTPNVVIKAKKQIVGIKGIVHTSSAVECIICRCRIATVFDDRVFLSGNPDYPNHVFYCGRNDAGYTDASYFGVLDFVTDGVGVSPITAMMPVADKLMVLKSDTEQEGAVYFHTPTETNDGLAPKVYPSVQGLAGIGCAGACINFLDDPIFVSRLGVEAMGRLSTRLERAVEHRSSLIDAKFTGLDLSHAKLAEWGGYLVMLVDGRIFLADSRAQYTGELGTPQYEWFYLEDIGTWSGQYLEYRYMRDSFGLEKYTVRHGTGENKIDLPIAPADEALRGTVANAEDADAVYDGFVQEDGADTNIKIAYVVGKRDGKDVALLVETNECYIGGTFCPASAITTIGGNLFFGTTSGVVCSFNFDKRDEYGEIPNEYYTFDGRTIVCGLATRMDNCGIPHLTKSTAKKSTVVKTRSKQVSTAKIKVRTNKRPYEQIDRINSATFSFDNIDFSDFTFNTQEQSLFAVREKEKKWVEKQYYLYSDEFRRPFALYYISFRYTVAGRYKE